MDANTTFVLKELLNRYELGGSAAVLGTPDAQPTGSQTEISSEAWLTENGFSSVQRIEPVFSDAPDDLYDLVLVEDGALRLASADAVAFATKSVRFGGVTICLVYNAVAPAAPGGVYGVVEHHLLAGLHILRASALTRDTEDPDVETVEPYTTALAGTRVDPADRRYLVAFWKPVPPLQQTDERGRRSGRSAEHLPGADAYARAYALRGGRSLEPPLTCVEFTPTMATEGFAWALHVPELAHLADDQTGGRSPLVLFEDDIPIGPPGAQHGQVRQRGRGRYSHWGDWLLFSTSRNDEPSRHRYSYGLPATLLAGASAGTGLPSLGEHRQVKPARKSSVGSAKSRDKGLSG